MMQRQPTPRIPLFFNTNQHHSGPPQRGQAPITPIRPPSSAQQYQNYQLGNCEPPPAGQQQYVQQSGDQQYVQPSRNQQYMQQFADQPYQQYGDPQYGGQHYGGQHYGGQLCGGEVDPSQGVADDFASQIANAMINL